MSMARTTSKRTSQVTDPETIGLLSRKPKNQYSLKKREIPYRQCRAKSSALGASDIRSPSQQQRGIPSQLRRGCGGELPGLMVSQPSGLLNRHGALHHTDAKAKEATRQDWLQRLRPRPIRAPSSIGR